jgi:hypothetical protein
MAVQLVPLSPHLRLINLMMTGSALAPTHLVIGKRSERSALALRTGCITVTVPRSAFCTSCVTVTVHRHPTHLGVITVNGSRWLSTPHACSGCSTVAPTHLVIRVNGFTCELSSCTVRWFHVETPRISYGDTGFSALSSPRAVDHGERFHVEPHASACILGNGSRWLSRTS